MQGSIALGGASLPGAVPFLLSQEFWLTARFVRMFLTAVWDVSPQANIQRATVRRTALGESERGRRDNEVHLGTMASDKGLYLHFYWGFSDACNGRRNNSDTTGRNGRFGVVAVALSGISTVGYPVVWNFRVSRHRR